MKRWHIIRRGKRWAVRKATAKRATKILLTQAEAIALAVEKGGKTFIHKADGSVEKTFET